MKRLLLSAAIAAALVGCVKNDIDENIPAVEPQEREIIINVSSSERYADTRVTINKDEQSGNYFLLWDEIDKLGGWVSGAANLSEFSMIEGTLTDDKTSADFSGTLTTDGDYRLVYPHNASAQIENDLHDISLASQTVDMSADGLCSDKSSAFLISPMLNADNNRGVTMQHVGAVVNVGMRFSALAEIAEGVTFELKSISLLTLGDTYFTTEASLDLTKSVDSDGFIIDRSNVDGPGAPMYAMAATRGSMFGQSMYSANITNSPAIVDYTEENNATYYVPINVLPYKMEYSDQPFVIDVTLKGSDSKYYQNTFFITPGGDDDSELYAIDRATICGMNFACDMTEATITDESWLMLAASSYDGGSGSKVDPYQIATAEQLAYLGVQTYNYETEGKYYLLTADIDLQGIQWINFDRGAFDGTLDGAGHTITGLKAIYPEYSNIGLIGDSYEGSTIKNLIVEGEIEGDDYVGGIVGDCCGKIINCGFRGSVKAMCGGAYVGGVAGYADDGQILNSFNAAAVSSDASYAYLGGIVGCSSDATVRNCYNSGVLQSVDCVGAIAGELDEEYLSNNYSNKAYCEDADYLYLDGTVESDAAVVAEALNSTINYTYGLYGWKVENGAPVLDFTKPSTAVAPWDARAASSFAGGSGTKNDPYQIATAEQLAYLGVLSKLNQTYELYFVLTADIDLQNIPWIDYEDAGYFEGELDGAGHTITGLKAIYPNSPTVGLLDCISDVAVVKNLVVEGDVEGAQSVGGIVGYCYDGGTIKNCGFRGSVKSYDEYSSVGGLAGYAYNASILNSFNAATVTSAGPDSSVGGILGCDPDGESVVSGCYNSGAIQAAATSTVGAIVGYSEYATIENCYTTTAYNADDSGDGIDGTVATDAAAVVAAFNATINDTYELYGWKLEGGAAVLDFANKSTAPAPWSERIADSFAGGDGSESNPYQIATGEQLALLIQKIDEADDDFIYDYYTLTNDIDLLNIPWVLSKYELRATLDGAGHTIKGLYMPYAHESYVGLFGGGMHRLGTIKNLIVEGEVIGGYQVGGFTSTSSGVIENCGFRGSVKAMDEDQVYAGGIVGDLDAGSIINSFNEATVSAQVYNSDTFVGGIAGASSVSLSLCYNSGVVGPNDMSKDYIGGVAGNCADKGVFCFTNAAYAIAGTSYAFDGVVNADAAAVVASLNAVIANQTGLHTWKVDSGKATLDFASPVVAEDSWMDYVAGEIAVGDGTKSDPYQISTPEEFALLVSMSFERHSFGNEYVILTNNIDLSAHNWIETAADISFRGNFDGQFDGQGYTISGVRMNNVRTTSSSLFGYTDTDAKIMNLYVEGDIKGVGEIGGIVTLNMGTIMNCGFSGTLAPLSSKFEVGGVAARNYGAIINSFNTATINCDDLSDDINGESSAGGITSGGYSGSNVKVDNCYNIGVIKDAKAQLEYIGAIVGYSYEDYDNNFSTVQYDGDTYNSHNGTIVAVADLISLLEVKVDYYYAAYHWKMGDEGYPVFDWDRQSTAEYFPGHWNDTEANGYQSGNGSAADPYQIATASQMAYFGTQLQQGSSTDFYYELVNDIDLREIPWVSNYPYDIRFNGIFDGKGHTISGLLTSKGSEYTYVAIFGNVAEDAVVANLNIRGEFRSGSTDGSGYVAAFANSNYGTITNCSFVGSASVISKWDHATAAGIAISNDGKIYNCYVNADITNEVINGNSAGITGSNAGFIESCYFVGTLAGGKYRDGVCRGNSPVSGTAFSVEADDYTWDGCNGEQMPIDDMKTQTFVDTFNAIVDADTQERGACGWKMGTGDYPYPIFDFPATPAVD